MSNIQSKPAVPDEDDEMETNSAAASDNEYDEDDSFLASGDEESDYDSLEESAEETDDDDPDYDPEDDPEVLQAQVQQKNQEIAALKSLVRSYEHEIKALQSQLALKREIGH